MSRVGKQPITIPDKIKVTYSDRILTVTGEKGTLNQNINPAIDLQIEDGVMNVTMFSEDRNSRALQGLIRAAGMKIHAENGNTKAAVTMGRKAQADLQFYGSSLSPPNKIESILAEITETLANMDITSGGQ